MQTQRELAVNDSVKEVRLAHYTVIKTIQQNNSPQTVLSK